MPTYTVDIVTEGVITYDLEADSLEQGELQAGALAAQLCTSRSVKVGDHGVLHTGSLVKRQPEVQSVLEQPDDQEPVVTLESHPDNATAYRPLFRWTCTCGATGMWAGYVSIAQTQGVIHGRRFGCDASGI